MDFWLRFFDLETRFSFRILCCWAYRWICSAILSGKHLASWWFGKGRNYFILHRFEIIKETLTSRYFCFQPGRVVTLVEEKQVCFIYTAWMIVKFHCTKLFWLGRIDRYHRGPQRKEWFNIQAIDIFLMAITWSNKFARRELLFCNSFNRLGVNQAVQCKIYRFFWRGHFRHTVWMSD